MHRRDGGGFEVVEVARKPGHLFSTRHQFRSARNTVRVSCSSPPRAVVFVVPCERPHCFCHPDPVRPAREPEHVRDLLPAVRGGDDPLQRV